MTLREAYSKLGIADNIISAANVASKTRHTYLTEELLLANTDPITNQQILDTLADFYSTNYITDVQTLKFADNIAKILGYTNLQKYSIIPMMHDTTLLVCYKEAAIENAEASTVVRSLIASMKYRTSIIPATLFNYIFSKYVRAEMIAQDAVQIAKTEINPVHIIHEEDAVSTVGSTVYQIIKSAYNMHASDIHFIPTEKGMSVDFSIDGKKHPFRSFETNLATISRKIQVDSMISNNNPKDPCKGRLPYNVDGKDLNIRVNIIPTDKGDDINLRIIYSDLISLDQIGMNPDCYEAFDNALHMSRGLVLVVGPMDSGKTTTLYGGLDRINDGSRTICCLEDPVEIVMPGITQKSVTDTFTFDDGVETFLRHNADVITIGEIRNLVTATSVIKAASTGKLVTSTLHTVSAISTISRLKNLGVPLDAITDYVAVILAQRLVRKVCPYCSKDEELPIDHPWRKIFKLGNKSITIKRPVGCTHCHNFGYAGRVVLQEYIRMTKDLRHAIEHGSTTTDLEDQLSQNGFKTLLQDGVEKALAGITTFDEILPYALDII